VDKLEFQSGGIAGGCLTFFVFAPLKNPGKDRLSFFTTGLGSRQIIHTRFEAVIFSFFFLNFQLSFPHNYAVYQLTLYHYFLLFAIV